MQMEAGAQPLAGAESPMRNLIRCIPDLPAAKWYETDSKKGFRDVGHVRPPKGQSDPHMVAQRDLHPVLAKEIVQRGHRGLGTDKRGCAIFLTLEQERESYKQSVAKH